MKRLVALVALLLTAGLGASRFVGQTSAAFSAGVANTSTFSAAATFPSTCRQHSALWMTGMEHGMDTSAGGGVWSAGIAAGSATVDTVVKRSGGSSLRLDVGGIDAYRGRLLPPGAGVLVKSFALRFPTLPATDVAGLGGVTVPSSGTYLAYRYIAATKQLAIGFPGQTVGSTISLEPATWYTIDVRVNVSGTTHVADWQIDGVPQPSTSIAGTPTAVYAAGWGTASGDTFSANFDDMVMSTVSADFPIGRARIHSLRPNGMGANVGEANFLDDDGTAVDALSWARLADPVAGDAASHVRQTATSATSYLEMTVQDTTEVCVRSAMAMMVYDPLDTNQANHGRTEVVSGAATTVVWDGAMNARNTFMNPKAVPVVPDGGTWTPAALNNLVYRFGYSSDANPQPRWASLVVEYDAG